MQFLNSSLRSLPAASPIQIFYRTYTKRFSPAATGGSSGSMAKRGQVEDAVNRLEEDFRLNGFGKVIIHAGFEAPFAVALHGVRRQGDDGQAPAGRRFELPDEPGR